MGGVKKMVKNKKNIISTNNTDVKHRIHFSDISSCKNIQKR